ncbi:MAG: PEGA domain-containing protein, partial [Acidobacteriota bacterium]
AAAELGAVGGWLQPQLGGRYLLLPGRYSIRAEKAGHRPIDVEIDVGSEARQELGLRFEKLPGVLEVAVASGAGGGDLDLDWTLLVDGTARDAPGGRLELEPGRYAVRAEAPRHRAAEVDVEMAGAGAVERVELTLEPLWATLTFESEPSGARLRVDGRDVGRTPASVELLEGARVYTLSRAGFAPRRGSVTVVAGQDQGVGPVELRPSDGNVAVTSEPAGATVRVGGRYRGETPLDLALEPGREHTLLFEKAGHTAVERRLSLDPGEAREVHAELAAEVGELELQIFPADARVRVNGVEVESRSMRLPTARDHRIEVDRDGFVAETLDVRATPGQVQRIDVRLATVEAEREREIQSLDRTAEGQRLALIEPGSFQMGASRRESGRRANETLREVEARPR